MEALAERDQSQTAPQMLTAVWLLRRVPRSAGHAAPPPQGLHVTTPFLESVSRELGIKAEAHTRQRVYLCAVYLTGKLTITVPHTNVCTIQS